MQRPDLLIQHLYFVDLLVYMVMTAKPHRIVHFLFQIVKPLLCRAVDIRHKRLLSFAFPWLKYTTNHSFLNKFLPFCDKANAVYFPYE